MRMLMKEQLKNSGFPKFTENEYQANTKRQLAIYFTISKMRTNKENQR